MLGIYQNPFERGKLIVLENRLLAAANHINEGRRVAA